MLDVLAGERFGIALVRVFAEREGKKLDGQFQAFTYRIENGKITEFWFMVEDRYAVDAFLVVSRPTTDRPSWAGSQGRC